MVMLLHSGFQVFGWPEHWSDTTFGLILLESFCIIGVNVFVLITGYFSTKPKLHSLCNLFYICIFYELILLVMDLCIGHSVTFSRLFLITRSNWFIPTYLGLVLFAPIINAFCEKTTKLRLGCMITILLSYETYMGFFPAMPQIAVGFQYGCSVLSFIILYLIGRYIFIFGLPRLIIKNSLFIYIFCSLVIAIAESSVLSFGYGHITWLIYAYNNPLVILSSISFFVFFTRIEIKQNNVINHISKSVLAVLLVHASGSVVRFINPQYVCAFDRYSGIQLMIIWISLIIIIFFSTVFVDQIRLWTYKLLSILLLRNN